MCCVRFIILVCLKIVRTLSVMARFFKKCPLEERNFSGLLEEVLGDFLPYGTSLLLTSLIGFWFFCLFIHLLIKYLFSNHWMMLGQVIIKVKFLPPSRCLEFSGGNRFINRLSFLQIKKNFFNWRIIALQNFVFFCHMSTRVSHRYTHILSFIRFFFNVDHF